MGDCDVSAILTSRIQKDITENIENIPKETDEIQTLTKNDKKSNRKKKNSTGSRKTSREEPTVITEEISNAGTVLSVGTIDKTVSSDQQALLSPERPKIFQNNNNPFMTVKNSGKKTGRKTSVQNESVSESSDSDDSNSNINANNDDRNNNTKKNRKKKDKKPPNKGRKISQTYVQAITITQESDQENSDNNSDSDSELSADDDTKTTEKSKDKQNKVKMNIKKAKSFFKRKFSTGSKKNDVQEISIKPEVEEVQHCWETDPVIATSSAEDKSSKKSKNKKHKKSKSKYTDSSESIDTSRQSSAVSGSSRADGIPVIADAQFDGTQNSSESDNELEEINLAS